MRDFFSVSSFFSSAIFRISGFRGSVSGGLPHINSVLPQRTLPFFCDISRIAAGTDDISHFLSPLISYTESLLNIYIIFNRDEQDNPVYSVRPC